MAEVITVSGPISPEKLGKTMSHVHLLSVLSVAEQKGPPPVLTASEQVLSKRLVTMDILGVCRRNAYAVDDNLILGDIDDAISELMFFKRYGGGSIAEASVYSTAAPTPQTAAAIIRRESLAPPQPAVTPAPQTRGTITQSHQICRRFGKAPTFRR